MVSLLLAIIYVAFISLGLPDSLVGAGWPLMHTDLGVPTSYAGIVTMIIAFGTVVASLLSDRLTARFGAGLVTAASVATTALALFGFATAPSFLVVCLAAVPYGLGAGAVDAALNNFVALHYAARHMSWLHSFWGVGAAISPFIMGAAIAGGHGWSRGYLTVGIIQVVLAAGLFCTLPLWRHAPARPARGEAVDEAVVEDADVAESATGRRAAIPLRTVLPIPGVAMMLAAFFCYSAVEQTTALWASTYLVSERGVDIALAAEFASFFFIGITLGRFASGFIADRAGDRAMIRGGIAITLVGGALVLIPFGGVLVPLAGFTIVGLGCAPIYPAIIHATPSNFGAANSQAVIGVQMAAAYLGTTFMPPLFGAIAGALGIGLLPLYLLVFAGGMLLVSERLNSLVEGRGEGEIPAVQ